jgi:hypothetical protein
LLNNTKKNIVNYLYDSRFKFRSHFITRSPGLCGCTQTFRNCPADFIVRVDCGSWFMALLPSPTRSLHTHRRPQTKINFVRFQVLTAASMMFRIVFWDVLPCKMIVDRRFRGTYYLHHQGSSLLIEAVRTSETSVDNNFTRQYIPEEGAGLAQAV